jgi:SulP family sulfate permease
VLKETIKEESEPSSPERHGRRGDGRGAREGYGASYNSPGTSVLTNMLRNSPPRSVSAHSGESRTKSSGSSTADEGDAAKDDDERGELEAGRRKLVIAHNGQVKAKKVLEQKPLTEQTPLLPRREESEQTLSPSPYREEEHDVEGQQRRTRWRPKLLRAPTVLRKPFSDTKRAIQTLGHPRTWDKKAVFRVAVVEPAGYLPSVILGALLNVLDALSYGMILFPLGEPLFEKLGPAGISMFYVSCIISQLTFSLGGSIFKGGVGSEMIEVVPFFHKMAFTILEMVGEDNPTAVISTTITSYAISSVITGLVFFLMGICRFGYIVGFIPRHILIGCIGGVGWFLIATGLEVTARLDGNLKYNLETLYTLFHGHTLVLWLLPLVLAIFLYRSSKVYTSKYYLPSFILLIPAVFYFFTFALPNDGIPALRDSGWIFDAPAAGEPWWYFYTLYDFRAVHWGAVLSNVPAMFALTFFGVLHVPINIPALAFNIGEDHLDLDRELVAHGISNVLSGFAGSIQNYLVYTNSVLFIKSGGNSRVAGVGLAIATFFIMLAGPAIIGYIPVMMVGVLIFVLGFELVFEALWDPRKKLKALEYATVLVIVLVMGIYDFVIGIFVGIGLAFVSLVVQTSRVSAVRSNYSGEVAGSTVRRNPVQQSYLKRVGRQIHVTKLAGYLFFGTIVSVESQIRSLIAEEAFHQRPIRYLVFDLWHVTGIDYSAAEAFNRINRVFSRKGVSLVMSGVQQGSEIARSFGNVGLGEGGNEVRILPDLNAALESCENELLKALYARKEERGGGSASGGTQRRSLDGHRGSVSSTRSLRRSADQDVPRTASPLPLFDHAPSSPRRHHLAMAATAALTESDTHLHPSQLHHHHQHPTDSTTATKPSPALPRYSSFAEPLRLILQTFHGLTAHPSPDFWHPATKYFARQTLRAGDVLYNIGDAADGFYLLEEGILRAEYEMPQGHWSESIVAGTTCGELPFFAGERRSARVVAERDVVCWVLSRKGWEAMGRRAAGEVDEMGEKVSEGERAQLVEIREELMRLAFKMTAERMERVTGYVLTTAG